MMTKKMSRCSGNARCLEVGRGRSNVICVKYCTILEDHMIKGGTEV
jgi:hypothetical protein